MPSRYINDLRISDGAFRLLALISSLADGVGACQADNQRLGDLLGVDARTVTRYISQLLNAGVLFMRYENKVRELLITDNNASETVRSSSQTSEAEVPDIEELLTMWEKRLDVSIERHKPLYPIISDRLKSFTKDELKEALSNRIQFVKDSAWHNLPVNQAARNNILLVLENDSSVTKWLARVQTTAGAASSDISPLTFKTANSNMMK